MCRDIHPPYELAAQIEVVTDDSGHYGSSYCGHCNHRLTEEVRPSHCPNCKRRFVGGVKDTTPRGGSDF